MNTKIKDAEGVKPLRRCVQETIWEAINEYAESCGGDTSSATCNVRRMSAVVLVENIVATEIFFEAKKLTTKP